jgi:GDPmannose 4,6-dehydratase
MAKTAFITGITGQDGSYLAELLLSKGYKVVGLVYKDKLGITNIDHIKNKLILARGSLDSFDSLKKILLKHKPDEVYNLGGITFVPTSWEKPALTYDVNSLGLVRILEVVRDHLPKTRLYQASTAKIFGNPVVDPQTELTPIEPTDPYAVSKACAHFTIKNFRSHFQLFAVSGILYNHESERRGEEFVTRKITMGAAKIKLGLAKKLALGNINAKQDWGYAPDYVEAMWLMLQQDKPDDYIIATGKLHTVRKVCEIAFSELDLDWQDYVVKDPRFFRKEIPRALCGNPDKAEKKLNWQPKTSFSDMIKKMVRYDLAKLKKE